MSTFRNIKNVLIVEDNPDLLQLLRLLLEKYNFTVFCANDGSEAIDILSNNSVDVLFTDFRMPKVSGIELLAWCRARGKHIPVVFMTAEHILPEKELIALGDCCATMIRKPVDFKIIHNALCAAETLSHHNQCLHSF